MAKPFPTGKAGVSRRRGTRQRTKKGSPRRELAESPASRGPSRRNLSASSRQGRYEGVNGSF